MDEHMLRAATKARSALAVLAAELGEPSPDMAQALAIIEQMLGDIEAGRHPLDRPDDWPQRDRWSDRPHWDRWRWAIKMESVRLSGDPLESLAGIDEIITRGDREAFTGLLHAIIEQPDGPVADRVRTLYERVQHRAADPEFAAWPQYQAAYWLAVAIGQFRLADVAQRQVPSDDPTIMHAVYVLADYPVLAALAAERTQATRLDGRACRAIYEDARQRIDWQAMPPHEREFAQRLGVGP